MAKTIELPDVSDVSVGVLGGTGELGRGLAARFAAAGHRVFLGSRERTRAESAVSRLPFGGTGNVRGLDNQECARTADVVLLAVPWEGHAALLQECVDA